MLVSTPVLALTCAYPTVWLERTREADVIAEGFTSSIVSMKGPPRHLSTTPLLKQRAITAVLKRRPRL